MIGLRRKARIKALQVLFELDCTQHDQLEVIARYLKGNQTEELSIFTTDLVSGVMNNKKTIDADIKHFAPLFPVDQLSIIDRNILRLSIFEILHDNDKVPVKAAANEAIELAKLFGSNTSPKFINGVLGSIIANRVSTSTTKYID